MDDCSAKTIVFVTTGLLTGGAEAMLANLLTALDRRARRYAVVSLTGRTPLADRIEAAGTPVLCLGMSGPVGSLRGASRFLRTLRGLRPALLHGWMLHGNLAALLGGRMLHVPVFWGVRHSELVWRKEKAQALLLEWLLGRLSSLPQRIIYNSHEGRRLHESRGYSGRKALVIANGFDTAVFRPDPIARSEVRQSLAIPERSPLIGMLARYHPMKDHRTFIAAAKLLREGRRDARFALVGKGCDDSNATLTKLIRESGLSEAVLLLGERADAARVICAFDVGTLTSVSEGFANAIGEMMACGLACVVTDVGDARRIVGECGVVVPPGNPTALAQSWDAVLAGGPEGLRELGMPARARIEEKYSMPAVARAYEDAFLECL